jgi:hypothetical protein
MKAPLFYEFEQLAGAVVDGVASAAQLQRFNSILRESPELAQLYFEQARIHVALTLRGEGKSGAVNHLVYAEQMKKSVSPKVVQQLSPHPHRLRRVLPWLIKGGIAAVLLLGSGTVLWQVARPQQETKIVQDAGTPNFPVNLMSCKNIRGLVTPDILPGKISLQSGHAKIQLSSGVEVSFIGETDMDVNSDMEVTLNRGRVVTFVPPRATGFILRTSRLMIWDIGTIFVATAEATEDAVLVFKGSVQVVDAAGNGVQLCEQGEGVRVTGTSTALPLSVATDSAFSRFAGVTALEDLEATIQATLTLVSQSHVERQILAERINSIPFSTEAWVRPQPVPLNKETKSMTTKSTLALMTAGAMLAGTGVSASSTPIRVDTAFNQQRHWSTVFTNEVPLRWVWPSGATSVDLGITGLTTTFTTNMNVTTSNYVWKVFTGAVPSVDDLYTLTLTFKNGAATVNVQTAQLAVVKAAFGPTEVSTDYMEAKLWTKARSTMVIPYDVSWTAATVGAATSQLLITRGGMSDVTYPLTASGYHGWNIEKEGWGFGTFALALTFPGIAGAQWDASLIWNPKGTLIRLM